MAHDQTIAPAQCWNKAGTWRSDYAHRGLARTGWRAHIHPMPRFEAVLIRDLADPYWTLMRLDPPELLRSEFHFETRAEAMKETKRLTALKSDDNQFDGRKQL